MHRQDSLCELKRALELIYREWRDDDLHTERVEARPAALKIAVGMLKAATAAHDDGAMGA